MALDIAKGMSLIHAKGIIHFDLKPGNVLIDKTTEGNDPLTGFSCVICDFGFANFAEDARANIVAGLRIPGNMGITTRYAAPELFQRISSRKVTGRPGTDTDKAVDVFAYAMTLFFIFSGGVRPWDDVKGAAEIKNAVLQGIRPSMPRSMDGCSEIVKSLIRSCWSQDPGERPTFPEIIDTLLECTE